MHWTVTKNFDFDVAGARMLGYDIEATLNEAARSIVIEMLAAHVAPDSPPTLAIDMQPHEPERGRAEVSKPTRQHFGTDLIQARANDRFPVKP